MSTFAVAAFHDPTLAVGTRDIEAVVWVRAVDLGAEGVDVALSLWTPERAEVTALREVAPASVDRLAGAALVDERTLQVDAGRWSDGVHEFELTVALPAGSPGDEMLAARVAVLAGDEQVAGTLIAVTWTKAASDGEPAPAPGGPAAEPGTAATRADLPTGASPEPRHTGAGEPGTAAPCPSCGELPDDGDRFCEGCGGELAPA